MWVDIYAATNPNARLGVGPIANITSAQITRRLDQAGSGAFTMSAVDERRSLAQARRIAAVRGIVDGVVATIGAFVIDTLETRINTPGAPELVVSGDDLLRELAQRTVGELGIYEDDLRVLSYYGGATGGNLAATVSDGDTATAVNTVLTSGVWEYFGSQNQFNYVRLSFLAPNREPSTLLVEYSRGGGVWASMTATDKTAYTSPTTGVHYAWYRDGDIELTVPGDWATDTLNGHTGYFVRMSTGSTISAGVGEVRTINRGATTDGLSRLTAFFPLGWSLDAGGQTHTSRDVRMQFAGESVLAALCSLADKNGDHFRLGVGRSVRWLYSTDIRQDAPVIVAMTNGDAIRMESNPDVCLVTELSASQDTYPMISRIYPYSGGSGDERVTLAQTTRAAPSGYTMDKTANYLKRNLTEAQYGRTEIMQTFPEITPALQTPAARALAADFLFDAALTHLERYSTPNTLYTLRLAQCERELLPGAKITLVYDEWRDGVHVVAMRQDLILLETTVEYTDSGVRTTAVQASTVDSWPPSDGGLIAGFAAQLRHIPTWRGTGATSGQSGGGTAATVEVRDRQDVVIFRADHDDQVVEFGPSTVPHIEYNGTAVLIAGSPITPVLRASATWAPGNIGDSGVAVTTITVNGAAQGDVAGASHSELGGGDFIISAYVQDANVVRVLILNKAGELLTIGSGTLYVTVFKNP